jgi:dTDP-4-dehydrorhamnose reductase
MRPEKQILIIGRNAALAHDLGLMVWPSGHGVKVVDGAELGLLDVERLQRNIEALAPSLIISVVGSAMTDRAERDRTLTQARNHWAVGDLAEVASAGDIPLLHLSSDQVFSGDKDGAYLETDTPDAISVFGQSQAAGEAEIRARCRRHVILRTGWLFGTSGHNMLRTVLSLGKRGGRVHVPHDHISGPTPARELCAAIRRVSLAMLERPASEAYGHTIHFCATPAATLYEFARVALAHATAFQAAPDLVPITPSRFGVTGAAARRTELDCSIAIREFGLVQPDWHVALANCVDEICQVENLSLEQQIAALAETQLPYRGQAPEARRRGALPHGVIADRRRAS